MTAYNYSHNNKNVQLIDEFFIAIQLSKEKENIDTPMKEVHCRQQYK